MISQLQHGGKKKVTDDMTGGGTLSGWQRQLLYKKLVRCHNNNNNSNGNRSKPPMTFVLYSLIFLQLRHFIRNRFVVVVVVDDGVLLPRVKSAKKFANFRCTRAVTVFFLFIILFIARLHLPINSCSLL